MTDEAAKLARELAEASMEQCDLWNVRDEPGELSAELTAAIDRIIRTALAAKDAEIERLREAATDAEKCIGDFMHGRWPQLRQDDVLMKLRAAIQQGESHAG